MPKDKDPDELAALETRVTELELFRAQLEEERAAPSNSLTLEFGAATDKRLAEIEAKLKTFRK